MQILGTALGTAARQRTLGTTVVTPQQAAGPVQGLARIATRAIRQPTATEAAEYRRITTPIEKQDHLLAFAQGRRHPVEQRLRHPRSQGLVTDVEQIDTRRLRTTGAPVQEQMAVTPIPGIVQALQ